MTLSAPIFVGFLPKMTQPRPEWLKVPSVREICSVSECISKAPDNRIHHWTHNPFGFYATEALALSVSNDPTQHYDLYAYELFPVACSDRQLIPFEITPESGQVPGGYGFLGFDIVSRSSGDSFECSPLSCNHMASEFTTNASCLIDDETDAYQILLQMSRPDSGVEPGPYYLFKVYRKTHR